MVPILPEAGGLRQSGSTRQAFGAVAVTFSDDPGSLAELLLHEMQHVKLAVLADQFDLFDQTDGRLFSVPWRRDRRPVYGLLHGTYAHLALAELWRARARATPDRPTVDRYRMYRSWVGGRDRHDAGGRLPVADRGALRRGNARHGAGLGR